MRNSVAVFALAAALATAGVNSQSIVQIQTKTSASSVDIEGDDIMAQVTNRDGDSCFTESLNNEVGADDLPGAINSYEDGAVLGACLRFPMPGGEVPLVTMLFVDADPNVSEDWEPDWVRVYLDDNTWADCVAPSGAVVNEDTPLALTCGDFEG